MLPEEIRARLFALQDEKYRDFQAKLMPGIDPERIIGVRTPELRKLAGVLAGDAEIGAFLDELPHTYYDEMNLHGFIIGRTKDYETALARTDAFLPYVDNWATCDLLRPAAFLKNREKLPAEICRWMAGPETFTVRFGIEMAMSHFLDRDYDPVWPERVAGLCSEEYYVNMVIAWYFATALAKQWESVIPYLEERRLAPWVHDKTIQKAIESRRISEAQKQYLRSLRRGKQQRDAEETHD